MFRNVLFICRHGQFSKNISGAATLRYSHLQLLHSVLPDATFTIVFLLPDAPAFEDGEKIADRVYYLDGQSGVKPLFLRKLFFLFPGSAKFKYFFEEVNKFTFRQLQGIVDEVRPDLIWTEELLYNILALQVKTTTPVVFSHHDFLWKIKQIKNGKSVKTEACRQAEEDLIRRNNFIACASQSERDEILGINPDATTVVLYPHYPELQSSGEPRTPQPALVHLGGLSVTANLFGLKRFLEIAWPRISSKHKPIMEVTGQAGNGTGELVALMERLGITYRGFVDNLDEVMRPYDIHLIPYEENTGVRTRIPLALNYNQLLMGMRRACAGVSGLKHMENCILADSQEEMADYINLIYSNQIPVRQIADNGKALFRHAFTLGGQAPGMKSFLAAVKAKKDKG